MFEDIKLNANSEAVTQRETPHGMLRTLFVSPQSDQDTTHQALLRARYDDTRMVFTLVTGQHAEALAEKTITFLWEQFPAVDVTLRQFADLVQNFLQGEARTIAPDDESRHAVVMGALTRESNAGKGWLAWLGTSGIFILDRNSEPMNLETGLMLGEGWSPKQGIMPEAAQVHADVVLINTISRLLIFTNVLRPVISEVPVLGRAALQRIAAKQAQQIPAVLFDLKAFSVVNVPQHLNVYYRWDDATHVTLFWSGAEEATGYRVEQATLPSFEDATLLAELADSRQRLYRVQPPPEQEVFYRVTPIVKDVVGKPSNLIVVTPVPLVAPSIESIQWLSSGGFRITWTNIPQADLYELESSPDPDFDSPETAIIYRGSAPLHETSGDTPTGWYYRVRSLNTHFAPRTPSSWSATRRAPVQLETPQFTTINRQVLVWRPVIGAKSYEVRRFKGKDDKGRSAEQSVIAIEGNQYPIPDTEPSVYQVRAVRDIGDDFSASQWSYPATVGAWEGDLSVATLVENAEPSSQTLEAPLPVRAKPIATQADIESGAVSPPSTFWRLLFLAGAGALALGLIVGLIGGPRLGIGLDPTNTPLTQEDRIATQAQSTALWVNATERASLSDQLNQSEALLREQNLSATAEAERFNRLSSTATADSITVATLDAQLNNYIATATFSAEQINNMLNLNQALVTERESLIMTATADANQNATAAAYIDELNATIEENKATISALEKMLATTEYNLQSVAATATTQAIYVSTLEAEYLPTPTPIPTVTPNPYIFGKQE